jgi:hypothetical protein
LTPLHASLLLKPAEGDVLVQIEIEVLEPVKATAWMDPGI